MIGRLMLSLKKAVDAQQPVSEWSLTSVVHTSNTGSRDMKHPYNMRFAPRSDEDTFVPAEGDIPLATVPSATHVLVSRSELITTA